MWGADGLWNETAWRGRPDIQRLNICVVEAEEKLWLYRVEDAVLTIEVRPSAIAPGKAIAPGISQVVLKRLIDAEQVLERLSVAEAICYLKSIQAVVQ